jgi:hypothetical protein
VIIYLPVVIGLWLWETTRPRVPRPTGKNDDSNIQNLASRATKTTIGKYRTCNEARALRSWRGPLRRGASIVHP